MTWHVLEVSLELIRCLRDIVAILARYDADLAGQIRRAASSVPANLSEGQRRAGRDRCYHYRVAAGSAEEVRAALRTAAAWGYVDGDAVARPLALLDRLGAMLYRMTDGSSPGGAGDPLRQGQFTVASCASVR